MEVRFVPIEKINLTNNPFPEGDYEMLTESIKRVGLQYPILVARNTNGYYNIIDGRTRYKALKHLGYTEIPCAVLSDEIASLVQYDVELYRRHLPKELLEQYQKKANDIILKTVHKRLEQLRGTIPPNMIEELKAGLSKNLWETFFKINRLYDLSKDTTIDVIAEYIASDLKVVKERDLFMKRCEELEIKNTEKSKELEVLRAKYSELKKQYEEFKESTRQKIEDIVHQRLEQLNESKDAVQLQKMQEKIRAEVEEIYRTQLEEKHKDLVHMSKELQKVKQEQEAVLEELDKYKRASKELEKYLEKYKDEVKAQQRVLQKAFSIPKLQRRIQHVKESLSDVNRDILSLIDFISLIPEASLDIDKDAINVSIQEVEKIYSEIDKSISELKKAVKSIK